MLDASLTHIVDMPTPQSTAIGSAHKYEGSDTPNLPYYRRSRKRPKDEQKKSEPTKDPDHQIDFIA